MNYYIGGAIASLAHGIYRTTADVDIIAEIQLEHVQAFVQSLKDTYYVDAEFNMESPEDVILTKLEWYQMGGGVSDRQWGDIVGVLKVQRQTIEREYLPHWAGEIGVADLLVRAFQEAGFF